MVVRETAMSTVNIINVLDGCGCRAVETWSQGGAFYV